MWRTFKGCDGHGQQYNRLLSKPGEKRINPYQHLFILPVVMPKNDDVGESGISMDI